MPSWFVVGELGLMNRNVPPSLFAIPFGLAGLAGVWRIMAERHGAPTEIGNALVVAAAAIWAILLGVLTTQAVARPRIFAAQLTDPVLSPFWALPAVVGMVLAQGLEPMIHHVAAGLFWTCFAVAQLLGGWLTGEWMAGTYDAGRLHPGYLLPTVAAGLIGGGGAAFFGHQGLGWMAFGIGAVSWLVFSAVLVGRLIVAERVPQSILPTLAIQLAPPAVAGNAYFALHGPQADPVAYALAGYLVSMLLVQSRLVLEYRRLAFVPSFWSFTFSATAAAALGLRWLAIQRPPTEALLAWTDASLITVLVGAIALGTVRALARGTFLTSQNPTASEGSAELRALSRSTPANAATPSDPSRLTHRF